MCKHIGCILYAGWPLHIQRPTKQKKKKKEKYKLVMERLELEVRIISSVSQPFIHPLFI